ncbi:hypothetical protein [Dickeya undicola]|uniref:Uncharacterized protein n=1 Tax=Dickeya undicola TaxID=1577887 RepID=A0A3N0FQJ7_9GAMM|nr:hypothetical protein [Dickeya undicola]RNM02393.1 hypothetical protein EF878_20195 [Dickeya undicola]
MKKDDADVAVVTDSFSRIPNHGYLIWTGEFKNGTAISAVLCDGSICTEKNKGGRAVALIDRKKPLEVENDELTVKEMLFLINALMDALIGASADINKKVTPEQMSKALRALDSLTRKG